jgi:hypothetical protein
VDHGQQVGIDVEVVERNPAEPGFVPQPIRCRVERTNGILMLHRRLVRDYKPRLSRVPGLLGDKQHDGPSADRQRDLLARRVTGGELSLGAVLVRLEEREREIATRAEETREQITRLTAVLDQGLFHKLIRVCHDPLMGRGDLTSEQWAGLEPLLPVGKKPGRPPVWSERQLINGIRWRTRTGAPGVTSPHATASGRPSTASSGAGSATAPGVGSSPNFRSRPTLKA